VALFPPIQEVFVSTYLNIGLIITSVALIASVILQSKGAGLGGLTGADTGGVFSARRGIEKTLFRITIGLSFLFFGLAIATVIVTG
jgi:preprotein translocase subunit SecG